MASLKIPSAHEQGHVNANCLVLQSTSRSSHRPMCARGWGLGSVYGRAEGRCLRWCGGDLCQQAPEYSRRRGAGATGNMIIFRRVGPTAGRERCIASRLRTWARPVAQSSCELQITNDGIAKLQFGSSTNSIQVGR